MRALEDLLNEVRDRESRRHLDDAIRAYQAGAFSSAIIATWIAVAYDLIGKIRELAESGDGQAGDFARGLDNAISSENGRDELQKIERDLLKVAHGTFEFIDSRELVELGRLRNDRHVCAHPAFVRPSEIFVPTPELVRLHLATAVDAVLSKEPAPGKRAVQRFINEIVSASFPESLTQLGAYLRARYFQTGKAALRRNLAELIVKGCLVRVQPDGTELDPVIVRRSALCAHALDSIQPVLLEEAMAAVIRKREENYGLSDDELLCFAASLGDMTAAWRALPESSHPRVEEALRSADVQLLADRGVFAAALDGETRKIVDARIVELDNWQLGTVIAQAPSERFAPAAIEAFTESGSYRNAERNMRALVLPLAGVLTAAQVPEVLAAVKDNPQIRMASRMPLLMVEFFDGSQPTFSECVFDWYALAQWLAENPPPGDETNQYSYPALFERVFAGMPGS